MQKLKRIVISMLAVFVTLSLVAYDNTAKKPDLYIEKAQLSEQEESIAKMLGADSNILIYDFKLDNNVKSVQINSYELMDGEWKLTSGGGGIAFTDDKGRLALKFENLAEGLWVAFQRENSDGATQYCTKPTEDFTGKTRATSVLKDLAEIHYEQEVPLVVQILSNQNFISSYGVEAFFTPEKYEKNNYEHIYAITIRFSQKTVTELDTTYQ